MKRYARFLSVLILGLMLAGCSESYEAERRLWWLKKEVDEVVVSPEAVNDPRVGELINKLTAFAEEMVLTNSAGEALMLAGSIQVLQEDFEAARSTYETIRSRYPGRTTLSLQALAAIATTYESADDWPGAVNIYEQMAEEFPETSAGLEAYLYVGQRYASVGDDANARKYFGRGLDLYNERLKVEFTPPQVRRLMGYKAIALQALKRWEDAADALASLARMQQGEERFRVLVSLARLYEARLEQPQRAIEIYRVILGEFEDPRIQEMARRRLQAMGESLPGQSDEESPTEEKNE